MWKVFVYLIEKKKCAKHNRLTDSFRARHSAATVMTLQAACLNFIPDIYLPSCVLQWFGHWSGLVWLVGKSDSAVCPFRLQISRYLLGVLSLPRTLCWSEFNSCQQGGHCSLGRLLVTRKAKQNWQIALLVSSATSIAQSGYSSL